MAELEQAMWEALKDYADNAVMPPEKRAILIWAYRELSRLAAEVERLADLVRQYELLLRVEADDGDD